MKDSSKGLKIKDLPVGERPYEKMLNFGPSVLSDAELLAIVIKTGVRGETSVDIAQRMLKGDEYSSGLAYLCDASHEELRSIKGIGNVKAIQIRAIAELAKRISTSAIYSESYFIKSPADASRLVMEELRFLKQEQFDIIMLDAKNRVIKYQNIFKGDLTTSIVHPREVFAEAIKKRCASIIAVHNHPSGDPTPSKEDIATTRRLVEAGGIIGIHVIDHIIIGDRNFVSMKELGLM